MKRITAGQWITGALLLVVLPHCAENFKPGLPPGSPFADDMVLTDDTVAHGVAAGDVTSRSALIWFRTVGPSKAQIEWTAGGEPPVRSAVISTVRERDFTATVSLEGLSPGTEYRYHILTGNDTATGRSDGTFVTAPSDEQSETQMFLWSGDLGGQQRCRRPESGYVVFDEMLRRHPSFGVLLGDLIYSDNRCPSPPNLPGSDFIASSLEGYRAKHRYQHEDRWLQRFLAAVPVYAMWDDHEVWNNFSGPYEPLMETARQALLEYWPIGTPEHDPARLYRKFRRGAHLEVFLLDTRQYRSANGEKDGPNKTMLGTAQRDWLLDGLVRSTATWKVIVTSVPLSNQKGGTLEIPGNDSWARGGDGTGFQTELRTIVNAILESRTQNVIWIAGDVHYAQVNAYDPDGDGTADFHEFICGPLSAAPGQPVLPNPDLGPTTLYSEGGFSNFGSISVDDERLRLTIIDTEGTTRFERVFPAHVRRANTPLQ